MEQGMGSGGVGSLAYCGNFLVSSWMASGIDQQRGAGGMVNRSGNEFLFAVAVFVRPHNDFEKSRDMDGSSRLDRSLSGYFREASISSTRRPFRRLPGIILHHILAPYAIARLFRRHRLVPLDRNRGGSQIAGAFAMVAVGRLHDGNRRLGLFPSRPGTDSLWHGLAGFRYLSRLLPAKHSREFVDQGIGKDQLQLLHLPLLRPARIGKSARRLGLRRTLSQSRPRLELRMAPALFACGHVDLSNGVLLVDRKTGHPRRQRAGVQTRG